MRLCPRLGPVNAHILDGDTLHDTFAMHRDGEPLFALMGLDLVAVAPAMFVVLNIIIKDKQISAANLIEISPPGNIGRLQDDNVHSFPMD